MENEDAPPSPGPDAKAGPTLQPLSYFYPEKSSLNAWLVISLTLGFIVGFVAAVFASWIFVNISIGHPPHPGEKYMIPPVLCELVLCLVGTGKIMRWIGRYRQEQLWTAEDRNKASRFFGIGFHLAFIICFVLLNLLMVV